MIIITDKQIVDAYYLHPGVSQSKLKELAGGVDSYLSIQRKKEEENQDKPHFNTGKAVDTLLTGNEADFDIDFYILESESKPSDVECAIINKVLQLVLENITSNPKEILSLSDYESLIEVAITESGWQPRWTMPVKIAKIVAVGETYFEGLKKSFGKKILTQKDYDLIMRIKDSLQQNPRTKNYFNREILAESNLVVYYQLPLFFEIKGIKCKALLDLLIVEVDENGNAVTMKPKDLKTSHGFTIDFPSSVRSFRYDIQGAFYSDALTNPTTVFPKGFPKITENTVVEPFEFIVESTTSPGKPLIFRMSEELLTTGRSGYNFGSKPIKGYYQLLDTYVYQETEGGWKEDKVVTEHDGVLEIDWNGIVTKDEYSV